MTPEWQAGHLTSWSRILLVLWPFLYLGSAHRVFNLHVLRSCASSLCTTFSFMSFLITSLHFSFDLPIFRCPPASIFHVIITTYSSVFLSTWSNHLGLGFYYFLTYVCPPALALISSFLIFSILFIPIIHLNILISVLSSKFCSAFPRARCHSLSLLESTLH